MGRNADNLENIALETLTMVVFVFTKKMVFIKDGFGSGHDEKEVYTIVFVICSHVSTFMIKRKCRVAKAFNDFELYSVTKPNALSYRSNINSQMTFSQGMKFAGSQRIMSRFPGNKMSHFPNFQMISIPDPR